MGDNSLYYPELDNRLRTKWYVYLQVNKLHLHTLSSVFLGKFWCFSQESVYKHCCILCKMI